jgi:hypothetical protein
MKKSVGVLIFISLLFGGYRVLHSNTLPPLSAISDIVKVSLLEFNTAVKNGNFTQFLLKSSSEFQKKYTPDDLSGIFGEFTEKGIDISPIINNPPYFTTNPHIDEFGDLVVDGFFLLDGHIPNAVDFSLEYTFEDNQWKIIAIRVKTWYDEQRPNSKELMLLIQKSLLTFDICIKNRNFTLLYDRLATSQKIEITPQDLMEIFAEFVDKQIDISGVEGRMPIFYFAPFFEDDEILVIQGFYRLELISGKNVPEFLDFELRFIKERGDWLLLGISVSAE